MSLHGLKRIDTEESISTIEVDTDYFYLLTGFTSMFLPGLHKVLVRDRVWITKTAQGNICINEWVIQRTIGRGAYANVRLCHNPLTEEKAAMRMINRTALRRKLLTQESADRFLWNCSRVMDFLTASHPSILNLIEIMYQPIHAELCSTKNSLEALISGSTFSGQYSCAPGNFPQWMQAILPLARKVNLVCEIPTEYKDFVNQVILNKSMLLPDGFLDTKVPIKNSMAINGNTKQQQQQSQQQDLTHRRMPSTSGKLKQYASIGAQQDSNLTPRYPQTTGCCNMNYDDNFVYIVEYCDGGTLQEAVRTADLTKLMIIFYQVIDGLCYMHFTNVVHQDVKLENIMLTSALQKGFKALVPPASKLLPRQVPTTTDLFFTSRQGTISDFLTLGISQASMSPTAIGTVSSDHSYGNSSDSVRRETKEAYNSSQVHMSTWTSLQGTKMASPKRDTGDTSVSKGLPPLSIPYTENFNPLGLNNETQFSLHALSESADITYYLLGDSDTAPYRAKISDFDTAIILEEEGIRLPTSDRVLKELRQMVYEYVRNLHRRFNAFMEDLAREESFDVPQHDTSNNGGTICKSVYEAGDTIDNKSASSISLSMSTSASISVSAAESATTCSSTLLIVDRYFPQPLSCDLNCSKLGIKQLPELETSTPQLDDALFTKADITTCSEMSDHDEACYPGAETQKANTTSLITSVSIYRLSGIYDTRSLEVSEHLLDKKPNPTRLPKRNHVVASGEQSAHDASLLTSSLVLWDDPHKDEARDVVSDSNTGDDQVMRMLHATQFALLYSTDNTLVIESESIGLSKYNPLYTDDNSAHAKKESKDLTASHLTPEGTAHPQKVTKEPLYLDAATPADYSLVLASGDFSAKQNPDDECDGGDTEVRRIRLTIVSKIEDFLQEELQTNNLNAILQAYITSVGQINMAPAMPSKTYFISNTMGTPNIVAPESRFTSQMRMESITIRPLFSAIHADSWQTGVMLFHALTGVVRRIPLYRYSQEAFLLCKSFGLLIADLLCGLLDYVPSHRYTLFECMFHPAVSPRELRLPMGIPAKGGSDICGTAAQSVLSHAYSAATSRTNNVRSLQKEAASDYLLLRRFHLWIVMRRRQYIIYNNRSCLKASTIDNSMLYTSADLPDLKSRITMLYLSVCNDSDNVGGPAKDTSVPQQKIKHTIDSYAQIRASAALECIMESRAQEKLKSPNSSSDISGISIAQFADAHPDQEYASELRVVMGNSLTLDSYTTDDQLPESRDSKYRREYPAPSTVPRIPRVPGVKERDDAIQQLWDGAKAVDVLLEQAFARHGYHKALDKIPYRLPDFILYDRTRYNSLCDIISSAPFLTDPSSPMHLTPGRKQVFAYMKRQLTMYQERLTAIAKPDKPTLRLRMSLSMPDLRSPSLESNYTNIEHPLLDMYVGMKLQYMYKGECGQNSDGSSIKIPLLDAVLSDSFDNTLQSIVDSNMNLMLPDFPFRTKITLLDIYTGTISNVIDYTAQVINADVYRGRVRAAPPDQLDLSVIATNNTLRGIIDALRREQYKRLIDELAVLSAGVSFYDVGTQLWNTAMSWAFTEAAGHEEEPAIVVAASISKKRLPACIRPVPSAEAINNRRKHCVANAEPVGDIFDNTSLMNDNFSNLLSPLVSHTRNDSQKLSLTSTTTPPVQVQASAIKPPLTATIQPANKAPGMPNETQEISEIEPISVPAVQEHTDHAVPKLAIPPLKLEQLQSVQETASQVLSMNFMQSGTVSPDQGERNGDAADTTETSMSSIALRKSTGHGNTIVMKGGIGLETADSQGDKLVSTLAEKYATRSKLYDRAAVNKVVSMLDAQNKQEDLSDRRGSFVGHIDIGGDGKAEERFHLQNNLFMPSVGSYISPFTARKNLQEIGGLTGIFDDSICMTLDDDATRPGDEASIKTSSFMLEHGTDGDTSYATEISSVHLPRQGRIPLSSRLRNTSIIASDTESVSLPSIRLTHEHCASLPHTKSSSLIRAISIIDESVSHPLIVPLNYPAFGDFHTSDSYLCCCTSCLLVTGSASPCAQDRVQMLTSHYRFRLRYGLSVSWGPDVLHCRRGALHRNTFLYKARDTLTTGMCLPAEWINAYVHQEVTRWTGHLTEGCTPSTDNSLVAEIGTETSVTIGPKVATEADNSDKDVQPKSPKSQLAVPALNLSGFTLSFGDGETPVTCIRSINPEKPLEESPPHVSAQPIVPTLNIPRIEADGYAPTVRHIVPNAASDSSQTYESSYESLSSPPPAKRREHTGNELAYRQSGPNESSSIANTEQSPHGAQAAVPDIQAPSQPFLAGVFAINTAIPSTVHMNRTSNSASSTSIGQCSSNSSNS